MAFFGLSVSRRSAASSSAFFASSAAVGGGGAGGGGVYFGAVACNYGIGFFLPQIVKGFGLSNLQTGFVTAIPYAVGVVAIVYWGRRSDRTKERKFHTAFAVGLAAVGIAGSTFLPDPTLKMFACVS